MKIAVLSRNPNLYSTKRLVEAIEAKGHESVVIDHLKCIIELEKKSPRIYYNGEY
jgi:ribosomal protein S6--L-glutamate ligase